MGNHLLNVKGMLSKETSDFSMSLNIFHEPTRTAKSKVLTKFA